MKTRIRFRLIIACTVLLQAEATAAVPSIGFPAESFQLGTAPTLTAAVSDADADMTTALFEVLAPGASTWTAVGAAVTVPGAGTSAQQTGVVVQQSWAPAAPGLWSIRVTVNSSNGSSSVARTLDVLAGSRTLNPVNITAGNHRIFEFAGELVTAEKPSGTDTWVASGGNLILWSGGRIVLKPGFKAAQGSHFWAAVDHDMDGYSDIEEVTDTDGDGMPDAWEADHGLNPIVPDGGGDLDNDGTTNLNEYLCGRKPNDRADGATLPPNYNLVLKTPSGSYYGLNASTWVLTGVSAP